MMGSLAQLLPPVPTDDAAEALRVEHTRLRRRLVYSLWREDLWLRMSKNLGTVRSEAIGEPDMSANPFEASCSSAAALYDELPEVTQPNEPSRVAMAQLVDAAMLWPMMGRVQRDTLAMRDMLVRCSVDRAPGARLPELVFVPTPLDLVQVRPSPRNPRRPVEVREWVERPDPSSGRPMWTRDVWSIDPVPRHAVVDHHGHDMSDRYGLPPGGLVGEAYPAIRADGTPFLPYAHYSAAVSGALLDPFFRAELVQGTLNVGVLWTFFAHCVRSASWPQRWISGGQIASSTADNGVRRVVGDPATILSILRDPTFEGQVVAGQWGSASDPKAVAEAISIYERRFMGYVDIGPEFWRGSSDPRSGVALSLDRTGKIEAQRKYAPVFRPVDCDLLGKAAAMFNRAVGAPVLAETGWGVRYVSLPAPREQRREDREETIALLGQRLISRVEARARITGETEEIAAAALAALEASSSSSGGNASTETDTDTDTDRENGNGDDGG